MDKIPVCVVVTVKNEERNIARCLTSLGDFAHVIVVDSKSDDRTVSIARDFGAETVSFQWNGKYPKKRQWCLDCLAIPFDWVFWVDADEVLTQEIIEEMRVLFATDVSSYCGFFVRGRYIWNNQVLRHGMTNNKIALFNRRYMEFPVVNDLDIDGMGEMEGHYQPVRKSGSDAFRLGQLSSPLLHYAYEDYDSWDGRHKRYAKWEAKMIKRGAYPSDPIALREMIKFFIRRSMFRSALVFLYSYCFKAGFLDGRNGLSFAISRARYCALVREELRRL